jgi:hypothetical protein
MTVGVLILDRRNSMATLTSCGNGVPDAKRPIFGLTGMFSLQMPYERATKHLLKLAGRYYYRSVPGTLLTIIFY